MNTVSSVYYGWAFFIACGAGSYYFAKRSINRDRHERRQMEVEQQMRRNRQIASVSMRGVDDGQKQQQQAPGDEGVTMTSQERDKAKQWENPEVFRTRKGDRFS